MILLDQTSFSKKDGTKMKTDNLLGDQMTY